MVSKINKWRADRARGPLTKTSVKFLLKQSVFHYKDSADQEQGFRSTALSRPWYDSLVRDCAAHPSKEERERRDANDTDSEDEDGVADIIDEAIEYGIFNETDDD